MLFDRGYASSSLWRRIDSVGGYVHTRIPAKWNQTIVSENRKHRGRARRLIGQSLQEAFVRLKRTHVDADVLCRIRGYGGTESRKEMKRFRVVAIRQPETNEFGLFATNVPSHMLAAEDIYQVYRLRWEVETFFKTLKSGCAANECPSSKVHIVETLLYAGLLRAALAMRAKAQQTWSLVRRINHGQWMHWWNRQLPAALVAVVGITESQLSIKQLLILLSDPSQGRLPTRFSFGGIP
ncbi:MAG: IS4 transposase [Myxococcota bacterium]|jgi:IS4 transposase